MRSYIGTGVAICSLWAMASCHMPRVEDKPAPPRVEGVHTFSVNGSVREMSIAPENPVFPEHEGKAEFVSYCAMCHSLKYISMQPDFPRKTWEAEVSKMISKYKAPIDTITGKKIVEYLVAIKSAD